MDVLVVMPHGREQIGDVMVMQGVEDVAATTTCADQPERAQQAKVVRRGAVAEPSGARELLDRALPAEQIGQQPQAAWRGERLQRLRQILGLCGT